MDFSSAQALVTRKSKLAKLSVENNQQGMSYDDAVKLGSEAAVTLETLSAFDIRFSFVAQEHKRAFTLAGALNWLEGLDRHDHLVWVKAVVTHIPTKETFDVEVQICKSNHKNSYPFAVTVVFMEQQALANKSVGDLNDYGVAIL